MKLFSLQPIAAVTLAISLTGCGADNYNISDLIKFRDSKVATWNNNDGNKDAKPNNKPAVIVDAQDPIQEEAVKEPTPATLTILKQPSSKMMASTETLNLSLSVNGSAAYKIDWFRNNQKIGSGSSYTRANTTLADSGTYSCTVTMGTLKRTCKSFNISVLNAPKISKVSGNQMATEGDNVNLAVTASGSDISYQWYRNGKALSGATKANLSLGQIALDEAGKYTCVVSNDIGSTVSQAANVSVVAAVINHIANLSWQHPSKRADGSTLDAADIKSYRIYYGSTDKAGYSEQTEVAGNIKNLSLENMDAGEYRFAISTIDKSGSESELSAPVTITLQ